MQKTYSSLIHNALSAKRKHFPKFKTYLFLQTLNSSKSARNSTRMGNLTSTCLSSSKGKSASQIADCSTWCPQPGQYISIRTFRELNPAPTSSPTSTRTETPSSGENFRSMEDLQGEGNSQPMTLTPQLLTQAVSQRLLESLRN
ncbi:putative AC4 protein [Tomato leaf curl Mayotte virus]|uniref:Putative AC4 protein n=1 Tax=Tomato leaf curl Mayotte virus TaxID=302100 RepID=Q5DVB3_9GEMI|nr:putative AC4 protein [Tomato leaf curl Mayotte virus]CAI26280.1 putative AC4 protein [Tomato leaf curl Mayotte virus]